MCQVTHNPLSIDYSIDNQAGHQKAPETLKLALHGHLISQLEQVQQKKVVETSAPLVQNVEKPLRVHTIKPLSWLSWFSNLLKSPLSFIRPATTELSSADADNVESETFEIIDTNVEAVRVEIPLFVQRRSPILKTMISIPNPDNDPIGHQLAYRAFIQSNHEFYADGLDFAEIKSARQQAASDYRDYIKTSELYPIADYASSANEV